MPGSAGGQGGRGVPGHAALMSTRTGDRSRAYRPACPGTSHRRPGAPHRPHTLTAGSARCGGRGRRIRHLGTRGARGCGRCRVGRCWCRDARRGDRQGRAGHLPCGSSKHKGPQGHQAMTGTTDVTAKRIGGRMSKNVMTSSCLDSYSLVLSGGPEWAWPGHRQGAEALPTDGAHAARNALYVTPPPPAAVTWQLQEAGPKQDQPNRSVHTFRGTPVLSVSLPGVGAILPPGGGCRCGGGGFRPGLCGVAVG